MKRQKLALAQKTPRVDRRAHMFLFLLAGVFTILVFRLWTIQVYRHDYYMEYSVRNQARKVPVQSIRGEIRDCNGKILAKDVNYRDVWIYREKKTITPAVRKSLELLSEILGRSYENLASVYLTKKRDSFNKRMEICIASRIPPPQYAALEERRIEFPEEAMVFPRKVPTRHYLYDSLAAHLLGYTGQIDEKEKDSPVYEEYAPYSLIGKLGIEKQYESYLHGSDGEVGITVDKSEIQHGPVREIKPAIPGNNIVLNIDYNLQYAAEQILGASAGVIIVSTTDNRILAMASNPSFNLNEITSKWSTYIRDPQKPLYSRAVDGKYEPGSVFKPFEGFALLEEMHIDPDNTTVFCPGHFTAWNNIWKCHWAPGHGHVNLYDAIRRSCNVFFYDQVGTKLNKPDGSKLRKWAIQFGFEDRTGIDLPSEKNPSLFPSKATLAGAEYPWYQGTGVSNAIGQGGVLFSPIQVHTAVCSIANNGLLYTPRLAQKILSHDGEVLKTFEPEIAGRIEASTKTFEIIHKAMWEVVNNNGTGRQLKVYDDFVMAGKTGTAQVGSDRTGKLNHGWFVCYGPFENPEIVITVMIEKTPFHGGTVASPLAKKILDVYLGYVSLEDLV